MTPDQEDRRRREDELDAAAAGAGTGAARSLGVGGSWGRVPAQREGQGQISSEVNRQVVDSGVRPQVGLGQQSQSQPPELQPPQQDLGSATTQAQLMEAPKGNK